ncbi:MAG: reverse transcriptase family protein, partial [Colwellia sp.]|nr:reverse transcriptase family protein [Colwellia sp.]
MNGTFPKFWNFANILPIPKPNKDHSNPSNYRPIAISSCLGRIFEKIMAKRLQHYCIKNKIFDNMQCGFQLNRNCDDVLTGFLTDVQTSIDFLSETDVVFTDFSKAYDSVWHDGLIHKLIQNGICGKFLKTLISFIQTRFTKVTTKNAESEWYHQTVGVPQGSALSPILFIIFTNDYQIKNKAYVKMACFADDTAFWTAPAQIGRDRYKELQKELNRFSDWCEKWKLKLNPSKCGSMNIRRANTIGHKYIPRYTIDATDPNNEILFSKYTVNGQKIKYQKIARYLGIWFDQNLNFNAHIKKVENKMTNQYWKLYFTIKSGIELNPMTIAILYKGMARASLEYGLIHYQPYEIKNKTSILQNKFLRLMIPCKKQNPIAALELATNIEPMEIRYKYLNLRQTARTFHSDQYHPSHKTYKCLQKKKELILRNKYRTKRNKNN